MSQQIDQAFPSNVPRQPSPHSDDDGGSFGTAFIILAIILVVSVIACVVGRLCSKGQHDPKPRQPPHAMSSKERGGPSSSSSSRQKNPHFQSKEGPGDIEFGFNKPMTSAKVAASEGFNGFKPSPIGEVYQNPRPNSETSVRGSEHDSKGQVRFATDRLQFKPVIRQH